MVEDRAKPVPAAAPAFVAEVDARAAAKLRARRLGAPRVLSGLGAMGVIGWSVVVPTVLGALLGGWLDRHHPGGHSWTLALLVAGLVLGCANAWIWVAKQAQAVSDEQAGDEPMGGGNG